MTDMLTPITPTLNAIGPTIQVMTVPAGSFFAPYWLVNIGIVIVFIFGMVTAYGWMTGWKNVWRRVWEYVVLSL